MTKEEVRKKKTLAGTIRLAEWERAAGKGLKWLEAERMGQRVFSSHSSASMTRCDECDGTRDERTAPRTAIDAAC